MKLEYEWDDELRAAEETRASAVAAARQRRDAAVKTAEQQAYVEKRRAQDDFNADVARANDTFYRVRARKYPPAYYEYIIARLDAERDYQAAMAAFTAPKGDSRQAAYRAWAAYDKRAVAAYDAAIEAAKRLLPKAPEEK